MPNRNAFSHQIAAVLGGLLLNQPACDTAEPVPAADPVSSILMLLAVLTVPVSSSR